MADSCKRASKSAAEALKVQQDLDSALLRERKRDAELSTARAAIESMAGVAKEQQTAVMELKRLLQEREGGRFVPLTMSWLLQQNDETVRGYVCLPKRGLLALISMCECVGLDQEICNNGAGNVAGAYV